MAVMIAGGGIGGLTLALALARRGRTSIVLEEAAKLDPVGAGIQLSPNATWVLSRLGLADALAAAAVAPEQADVRDAASGRVLVANRLGASAEKRWGAPYLTLTRAALQGFLLAAVEAEPCIEIRLGEGVKAIRQSAEGVVATTVDGELHGEALIGCDGLRSRVRDAVFGPRRPRFTSQTAWRGLARTDQKGPAKIEVWTGPRRHFVRYPVAPGWVNMVAVTQSNQMGDESWTTEGQGAELSSAFAKWPDPVLQTIAAVEQPWRSALFDRAPLERWSIGRVSLLGDAAHPMLPFLAQGAGMAIEDAWVATALLSDGGDVAEALKDYELARRARTTKVQGWASRNATLFHLPSPLAAGVFGAAKAMDAVRRSEPEARFDWLYGWRP